MLSSPAVETRAELIFNMDANMHYMRPIYAHRTFRFEVNTFVCVCLFHSSDYFQIFMQNHTRFKQENEKNNKIQLICVAKPFFTVNAYVALSNEARCWLAHGGKSREINWQCSGVFCVLLHLLEEQSDTYKMKSFAFGQTDWQRNTTHTQGTNTTFFLFVFKTFFQLQEKMWSKSQRKIT